MSGKPREERSGSLRQVPWRGTSKVRTVTWPWVDSRGQDSVGTNGLSVAAEMEPPWRAEEERTQPARAVTVRPRDYFFVVGFDETQSCQKRNKILSEVVLPTL